jgi:tetratricopeptide (TPR) repeat protein
LSAGLKEVLSVEETMRHLSVLVGLLFLLSCGETKPPAADLLQKGEAYYKDRKLVEAMDNFKQYVEYYPDSSQAARCSFMIGFIYANDFQDTLRARQSYEAFLKAYPQADPGLRMSAEWELKHLGQDISNLDFLAPPADSLKPVPEPVPAPGNK